MWELRAFERVWLLSVILRPCTHTLDFFFPLQKKKVLSLAWQLYILEQVPVDQVPLRNLECVPLSPACAQTEVWGVVTSTPKTPIV